MSDVGQAPHQVAGERDANSVTRILSVQSRLGNVLALGLICVLGVGSLTWYYANALRRQSRTQETAAAAANRAQGDVPLPSVGRIVQPPPVFDPLLSPSPGALDHPPPTATTLTEVPVAANSPPMASGLPAAKTPEQLAEERQLSGAVFAAPSTAGLQNAAGAGMAADVLRVGGGMEPSLDDRSASLGQPGGQAGVGPRESGSLAALLHPTVSAAVQAKMLPAQRLLLPKGAFIDCTLETAIDSTLPGMTTCVMATDAFGVDGKVVLLERGTKLIGETRGQVQQGAARLFVLWTEARSPTGVIVPLDSPGADELGRSGLPGEVDRHFWQRFGAAMLVSVIDGAVQAAAQSAHGGSGNVVVNPSASQDVLTEILKNTINVPPTVVKKNGDRIQVLVARDLDFRSVYELRAVAGR